jgi:hypothetical protein
MEKYLYSLLLIACFYTLPSCAQVKVPVAQVRGYFMIPIPGMVAVDENGRELNNQRDTVVTIYVEVTDSSVKWRKAWRAGRSFSLISYPVNKGQFIVGKTIHDENIVLTPQHGNTLFQLQISNDKKYEKSPQRVTGTEILLEGKWKNKLFYYKIKTLAQVASPLYQ